MEMHAVRSRAWLLGAGVATLVCVTALLALSASEQANDTLAVNTVGGTDSVAVDPGVSQLINPVVDLGPQ
jgi:hypothetical protein